MKKWFSKTWMVWMLLFDLMAMAPAFETGKIAFARWFVKLPIDGEIMRAVLAVLIAVVQAYFIWFMLTFVLDAMMIGLAFWCCRAEFALETF